jgi:ubiquinone/menaquinone biosynthesis C-methylase UbiE
VPQAFDLIAEAYDGWHDASDGRAIFNAEVKCLRTLCRDCRGEWLEVGVGTGRFASNLRVARGVDSSLSMVKIARERGLMVCLGFAEALPFPESVFDGVLLVLTLCFIADSKQALKECRRILRPAGNLCVGIISAHSPWGRAYERKKAEGHPVYASAKFFHVPEAVSLVENAGFTFKEAASTLFWNPDEAAETKPRVEAGYFPQAGFVGLSFGSAGWTSHYDCSRYASAKRS